MPAKKSKTKTPEVKRTPSTGRYPKPKPKQPEPYVRDYQKEKIWSAFRALAEEFGGETVLPWAHSVGVVGEDFDYYLTAAPGWVFAQELADDIV